MFDVADLTRECHEAAGDDVAYASDDELLAGAVEWMAVASAAEANGARLLAELQVRGVTDRCFGLKTAKWVAAQAKVDDRSVRRRLRIGLWLRRLPEVQVAALAEGRVTADHATVLAEAVANPRIGDQVAATASIWIRQAAETSFVDWSHQLAQAVRLLDQDGGYDPDKDRDRQRLRFSTLDEGITRLAGDLVGVDALEVRQLVEKQADRLFHQLKHEASRSADLPMPGRATLMAMALVELVRRGSIVDRDTTNGPAVDVTLVIQANRPDTSEPYAVAEVLDGEDACLTQTGLWERCGPAETTDGEIVPPKTAAILLCDPFITALIVDALGVPLDLGREIRFANRAQRRALAKRDGGCIFPGCDAPTGWCDAHHVIWWENHGSTDICNLALLCRYHHGVTHRRGWTMTAAGGDWFTWTTPSGDTLHSQRHRGRSPTAHPAYAPV